MFQYARRFWLPLLLVLLVPTTLWAISVARQAGSERQRQAQEAARRAETARVMASDPVRFEQYVRQVFIAADVIGQGEQDASGPCRSVSGFENGVGDPPPETRDCVIRDPGEEAPTVQLTLQDGRVFRWPPDGAVNPVP
ncbi:hypothetical protein [Deinococcus aerophilus]|uniref:Uncharacterized protein n=1 Tax=Deinococcus aerophilus TaxID=522488 RepID=A0ABQ2GUD0_9DEIO|nr:hypothetical protein [Deinococcus aerophilus]GGM12490.1 hypothetical protein GCM10010841_21260 [Deinococcus aerophilus]